jgi:hypothetical protein
MHSYEIDPVPARVTSVSGWAVVAILFTFLAMV